MTDPDCANSAHSWRCRSCPARDLAADRAVEVDDDDETRLIITFSMGPSSSVRRQLAKFPNSHSGQEKQLDSRVSSSPETFVVIS